MPMTKVANVSTGILDVYAQEILLDSVPLLVFRQFVDYKMDLTKKPGETIRFLKYADISAGGALLDEETPIKRNVMTQSDKFITMQEMGNAVSFSRRAQQANIRDLMEDARMLLGRDYRQVLDSYLRDTFGAVANKYYAAAGGAPGANIGATAIPMTDTLLKKLVTTAKNLSIPKFNRGGDSFYVFVGTPNQIEAIRDSSRWMDARRYSDPTQILNGESGMIDGVVFVDSTQMNDLDQAGVGFGGADVERGFFLGAHAVAYGESVPLELIEESPEDFKRKQAIAWYSIAGAGILNDYAIDVYTTA